MKVHYALALMALFNVLWFPIYEQTPYMVCGGLCLCVWAHARLYILICVLAIKLIFIFVMTYPSPFGYFKM